MIQKKYFSLCFVILFFTNFSVDAGVCNFFERLIFGFSPVQSDEQELCTEAKEFFNVSPDHGLYYARWPWNYFCSFTKHSGTWIDKKIWNNLDLQEKIFTMYHEISHEALGHPIKQYAVAFAMLALSSYCAHKYFSPFLAKKIAATFGIEHNIYLNNTITAIIISNITLLASSFYGQKCEQEANEEAIKALCDQERGDIVEYEIDHLEQILKEHGNIKSLWFSSIQDQIKHFKNALAQYS